MTAPKDALRLDGFTTQPQPFSNPRWQTVGRKKSAATPPPCLNCGCPWDSCLIHTEFCCDACAHFELPTSSALEKH